MHTNIKNYLEGGLLVKANVGFTSHEKKCMITEEREVRIDKLQYQKSESYLGRSGNSWKMVREYSTVTERFYLVFCVTWEYAIVRIHQTVNLRSVEFVLCKL